MAAPPMGGLTLLVSRMRAEFVGTPFSMFDVAPGGLGMAAAGVAILVVGWRLPPSERRAPASPGTVPRPFPEKPSRRVG